MDAPDCATIGAYFSRALRIRWPNSDGVDVRGVAPMFRIFAVVAGSCEISLIALDRTGTLGLTTGMLGTLANDAMGVKSLAGSNGSRL